jgi:hypothetical protein
MSARLVKLGDDVGYRVADARDLRKTVLGDEHVQRDGKSRQTVGSSRVGFCPVRITASQGGALRVLSQETCHTASVERWHSASLPVRALGRHWSMATAGAVTWLAIERAFKLLGCAEIVQVLDIGAVGSLFLEEIVDPSGHQLQMLHPAPRHGSRFAESSHRVGPKVIECV